MNYKHGQKLSTFREALRALANGYMLEDASHYLWYFNGDEINMRCPSGVVDDIINVEELNNEMPVTIHRPEEEKNVWTWEKIQRCERIEFGARLFSFERDFVVIDKETYIDVIDKDGERSWWGSALNYEGVVAYDRNGNLIDPKNY